MKLTILLLIPSFLCAQTKVGIGTTTPDSTLTIVGGLRIVTGGQGAGKVLVSDANGGARWQNLPGANTVLLFGDSITQDPVGWANIFCNNHSFIKDDRAVIGSVMTQNLQSLPAFDINTVPLYNPSVHKYLFMCYGVNDINNYGTVSAFQTSYDSAIVRILAKGYPPSKIVILSEWFFDPAQFWSATVKQQFVTATATVAAAHGCISINVYNPVLSEPNNYTYMADQLHPNDIGKVRWAQVVEVGHSF